MADLKTDYQDDVLNTEVNELRKYRMIQNDDGTVSFEDVTEYLQVGDSFGSADINETNKNFDNYYSLKDAVEITEGADLNDYTEFGNYVCSLANAGTLSNCPTTYGFTLKVERLEISEENLCRQILKTTIGIDYTRILLTTGWTEWQRDVPMPLKMGVFQKQVTPDSSGRVAIDTDLTSYSGGFAFCVPLGNQNAVVTVSSFVGGQAVAYVKNIATGEALTSAIQITAYVFYI